MDLSKFKQQIERGADGRALPPVEKWDPPFCGDLDMRIALDGSWHYNGTPIGRHSLVQLFASVLKKEAGSYFLVTPVEKVGLQVEDVPFIITGWRQSDDTLIFVTNMDDEFTVSQDNPLELRDPPAALRSSDASPIPYVKVRRNLWGRLHQNVYYQLIELADPKPMANGQTSFEMKSGQYLFSLGAVTV
ncbi:DUF1285 domain-containing protein [Alteromonas pelagimontana]|uniref:DUF1285 domain-containing protein n=1 Tax=Alteromonas pelagimontana TaxID=1858656 RepID=A0A6M4MCP5_9ALTE|nr:DUF1285 domain-containing protein [Alteromonas pelagimontana]QJR80903.1 DUF1285 domain-containing protein [Alteromonas pelagimontana]